jgi:hypothetical protein
LSLTEALGWLPRKSARLMPVTPKREFRCDDRLWVPATVKAAARGETMSAVLRRLLRDWLAEVER